MKMTKAMALMGMGAGVMFLIEKYKKPAMKEMDKMLDKTSDKLDKMM